MKKSLAAVLSAAVLCMAISACGGQNNASGTDDSTDNAAGSGGENGTIAVVTKTMNNPFHVTYGEAI